MRNIWIYIKYSKDGTVSRAQPYGSIRAIHQQEDTIVDGVNLAEWQLRRLLKGGYHQDGNCRIEKQPILRSSIN